MQDYRKEVSKGDEWGPRGYHLWESGGSVKWDERVMGLEHLSALPAASPGRLPTSGLMKEAGLPD